MNKELIVGNSKQLLAVNFEDNLISHATMLEALREPLLSLRVEAFKELCKKREQYRHPKDKEYTDFDRQTMLAAAVADVQAEYELVAGLEKLVAERLELIKLLIKEQ
jgi:hypothetical protein